MTKLSFGLDVLITLLIGVGQNTLREGMLKMISNAHQRVTQAERHPRSIDIAKSIEEPEHLSLPHDTKGEIVMKMIRPSCPHLKFKR